MSPSEQRVRIAADCHLHMYPSYPLAGTLAGLIRRLDALTPRTPALRLGLVTDRQGESFFKNTSRHTTDPFVIEAGPEDGALCVCHDGQVMVTLIAGRQINTAERIEVLSLAAAPDIPDGLPAREVIRRITDAGGMPVLPWAPGKWIGRRGALIHELVGEAQPGQLLLGDSAIRPCCFRLPAAMRLGIARGLGLIAGSDPLPFPGDERWMGRYGIVIDVDFDATRPVTGMRRILAGLRGAEHIAGRRGSPADTLFRMFAYRLRSR